MCTHTANTHFPHPLAHAFIDASRDTHRRNTQRSLPQAHADPDRLGHTHLHASRDTETTQSQHINTCLCTQTRVHQSSSIHTHRCCVQMRAHTETHAQTQTQRCTCADTDTHKAVHTHTHTQTCVNTAHTYMFTVNAHTQIQEYTPTQNIHGGTYTYSQGPEYTLIYTDVCSDVTDRYTHVHINSEIHGKTGCRQILNTYMCAHRHPDTQMQARTQTRMCTNIHVDTHLSQTPRTPSAVVERPPCAHRLPHVPGPSGARSGGRMPTPACPLQCPGAWQNPRPHPFISPWTVARGWTGARGWGLGPRRRRMQTAPGGGEEEAG